MAMTLLDTARMLQEEGLESDDMGALDVWLEDLSFEEQQELLVQGIEQILGRCKMIVTEWEQLVGKRIEMVEQFFLGGYLLVFEKGDYAHIAGDGEEHHGSHWPILCEDGLDLVKGAVLSMQRRKKVRELKALELLAWEMYRRSALGSPYRPKVNWFWYCIWKWLAIRRQEVRND